MLISDLGPLSFLSTHRLRSLCGGLLLSISLWACQAQNDSPDNGEPSPPKPSHSEQSTNQAPSHRSANSDQGLEVNISESDKALWEQANQVFKPLPLEAQSPPSNPTTAEKVQLGKMLFHDPRLSKSGAFSCNSCHNLASYGVDNRPTSIGHGFKTGTRNSPTVLNSDLQVAQFWDGRAADLEEQAEGPILNPVEMAMPDPDMLLQRLNSIPQYKEAFAEAFPKSKPSVSYKNVARAIASFERTLRSPSRFDQFLLGQGDALRPEEKEGLQTFMTQGCITCHNGVNVGGGMYQKFGLHHPYPHQSDRGRAEVTQKERDAYFFKVPSLRNVTKTYPYFHDGKVWDIHEAVKIMGKTQLGKDLSTEEVTQIVAFLDSLTGELPPEALQLPVLPPSGPDTPQPQI